MKLTLAENIRLFRRQRKLTQEKLAEALGVTVGAVYKWESGQSLPELNLIVELADLFDTSVDVLLGYQMKDNRLEPMLDRLCQYCRTLDPAALGEAEKALARYPHSFRAVHVCAQVYLAFGAGHHDQAELRRALELLERALVLLPQNEDPRISETTISGELATVRFLLGEREASLELWKRNNAGGMFSDGIGLFLAGYLDRPEEASPFLTEALLCGVSTLFTAIIGYVFLFRSRGDWDSALAASSWGLELLSRLKTETQTDSIDKTQAEMMAVLAYAQAQTGLREAAEESLRKAGTFAHRFDSQPDYSLKTLRFAEHMDQITVFDILGASAADSVAELLRLLDDPALSEQWEEITGHE
ncbi:MAG: helix-turn-helix domain-containing protein [Clostridia bacterium]